MHFEPAQADSETTNRLRRTVAASARLPASLTVEAAVSAVMCVLTERLTAGGAHVVFENLPSSIGEIFELCVVHREGQPTAKLDRAEFLAKVSDHLALTPAHAELVCSAVFAGVRAELPSDTIHTVAAQLPHGLKELWLGVPVAAPDLDVEVAPADTLRAAELELARRVTLPPDVTAAQAFTAVMSRFSRRLSGGEARQLLLGLPVPLRALIAPRVAGRREHADVFGRDELLRDVSADLGTSSELTERIIVETLRVAKRALPQQTIEAIDAQLPPDLAELWRVALPPHEA